MRITAIDVIHLRIPLLRPYRVAQGEVNNFENVLVRIHGGNAQVGLGEWAGSLGYIRSDAAQAADIIASNLAPRIVGLDSMNVEQVVDRLSPNDLDLLEPMAALEMAIWDLNGKLLNQPVYRLLGGLTKELIPVDYTLGRGRPIETARRARRMKERYGFSAFSVKVGGDPDLENDIQRVRLVRESVGPEAKIRLDANGGYRAHAAIHVLRAVESSAVELIEQPVPPGDTRALQQIAESVATPISIDEGLVTLQDAWDLAASGAVRIFNVKIPKNGGFLLSRKIAAIAEAAGLQCICGGAMALEIVRQASRHFAASIPLGNSDFAHEGPGPASQALEGNVAEDVVGYEHVSRHRGHVTVTDQPGIGVVENVAATARYSVSSRRVE